MKNNTLKHATIIAAAVALPCLIIEYRYQQWFPYHLNGPQFLQYFTGYMLTSYLALAVFSRAGTRARILLSNCMIAATILLSVSRLIQGCLHHKPVGYLVILSLCHLLLLLFMSRKIT